MCGKAGSGKSTMAKSLATEHDALLLCEDVWLARLFPAEINTFDDYIKYARRIKAVVAPMVVELLKHQSVVLDFPANTAESRTWFRSIFEAANVPHILHYVVASDALCLRHIAKRNVERPEGSHEISEEMFHHITSFFQPPSPSELFNVQIHAQEENAQAIGMTG